MEVVSRRVQLTLLVASRYLVYLGAWFASLLFRRRRGPGAVKSIATVWYAPYDQQGGSLMRMGAWKPYFEGQGYRYECFSLASYDEFLARYENADWASRYRYLRWVVWRRFAHFLQLRSYDVVWLHRGFLPHYYSLRRAFLEGCLRRMVGRVVLDCTDGSDYQANPTLMADTIARADRVTVHHSELAEAFRRHHADVVRIDFAMDPTPYPRRRSYDVQGLPVVGWMGSPGNFEFVRGLADVLEQVARVRPFVLRVVCRRPAPLEAPSVRVEYRDFADYHRTLGTFDVGICPQLTEDLGTRGKIAMKHQEFLILAVPQVCSPFGISEEAVHGEHVLIARTKAEWYAELLRLLTDEGLRERLGRQSRALFDRLYTYESLFPQVRAALTEFPPAAPRSE